jgi:hypothetical protein
MILQLAGNELHENVLYIYNSIRTYIERNDQTDFVVLHGHSMLQPCTPVFKRELVDLAEIGLDRCR